MTNIITPRKTAHLLRTAQQYVVCRDVDGLREATYRYPRTAEGWTMAQRKLASLRAMGYVCTEELT